MSLLRRLQCLLRVCPYRPASDETGCWGECTICGKRAGFVTREQLRAYADREDERELARKAAPNTKDPDHDL